MSFEQSMPYVIGFIVWVIYAIGHALGASSERKKQDALIKSLTIKNLSGEPK